MKMNNSPNVLSQRFTPAVKMETTSNSEVPKENKSNPEQMISESERNSRFKVLKKKKTNKKCCDCNAKFPQWASASFGILVCMNCSGKHRFLGPNISFVRSIAMDNWKEHEMRAMEIGGNKRFKEFLESEMVEGEVDYTSETIQRYKHDLLEEVEKEFVGINIVNKDKIEQKQSQEQNISETKEEIRKENVPLKLPIKINKEDIEKKETKPLEEQKTKVIMAESKQTSGNSESTGGKRGRRRGKDKRFTGKRIKKVNLEQLVTDDLKIKSKGKIKKKGLFSTTNKQTKKEESNENSKSEESNSKKNDISNEEKLIENNKNKIKKSKLNKFSGFGSDNLSGNISSESNKKEISVSSKVGFGVFGGYGSDDLNPPKKMKSSNASNGEQQGK